MEADKTPQPHQSVEANQDGIHSAHRRSYLHQHWRAGRRWHDKRHYIIRRVIRNIAVIALLVLGGMSIASFLLTRVFEGNHHTARAVWFIGCTLAIGLPFIAMLVAMRGYRSIAKPLFEIMAAVESVAKGDLSVRVSEKKIGGFGQLARSFNHMTSELARTDQQRRNLTADVAHELRTPLHIIQGNLEGILDGVYEPTEEHINATLDETRALARLVEDLRTLSLAEAGELPLVMEKVDIGELLEDIETSFSSQSEAKEIQLSTEVEESSRLLVNGDAGRLDQVLSNLVVNALRHTPRQGSVTLRSWVEESQVYMEVADSGEGIASEDLPFIFDRFWRGDRSRTHSSGVGGGLGLAIVRQLVEAHHGTITVTSAKGEGTIFLIILPQIDNSRSRVEESQTVDVDQQYKTVFAD